MKLRISVSFIILILFPVLIYSQKLSEEQNSWLKKAGIHEKNGWTYLHIEGSARERGFQYGYLLSNDIKEAIRILSEEWHYSTALDWQWLSDKADSLFTSKIDAEDLSEMDGIAEGMKAKGIQVTRKDIVTLNGWIELRGYWWPTVKDKINSPEKKKESCSSFIAVGSMTKDGGIVLGHNTMTSFYEPFCNVILDILPEKGHRILMQTTAGLIHSGTDFFLTDAGLVGSETTIGDFFPFDADGTPEFVRMRQATQYASSIDEWCDIMKKGNSGGYANAWLIGDINRNEIARLELGLKYIGFEKKKDGYFTGSNVAEDLRILRNETKTNETDIKISGVARRLRWKQLMTKFAGKIDLEAAKKFEADHYDMYLKKDTLSGRGLCSHWEADPQTSTSDSPFDPGGTVDAKVVDSKMAKEMSFEARWGSACGRDFNAKKFLEDNPQYEWMSGILKDMPTEPWTVFRAGEN